MDYEFELGVHQTIEGVLRSEMATSIRAEGYWLNAAKVADELADRMAQHKREGDDLEEIELRLFHGLAIPELRKHADRWRKKAGR